MEAIAEAIESEAIAEAIETEVLALVPTRNQGANTSYIKLKDAAPGTIPLKSSKSLETSSQLLARSTEILPTFKNSLLPLSPATREQIKTTFIKLLRAL